MITKITFSVFPQIVSSLEQFPPFNSFRGIAIMRKLYENFIFFHFQKRIIPAETIREIVFYFRLGIQPWYHNIYFTEVPSHLSFFNTVQGWAVWNEWKDAWKLWKRFLGEYKSFNFRHVTQYLFLSVNFFIRKIWH